MIHFLENSAMMSQNDTRIAEASARIGGNAVGHRCLMFRPVWTLVIWVMILFVWQASSWAEGAGASAGTSRKRLVPPDEQAIREVQAGLRDTANAAWWGFDPEDATAALQAALLSPAKKIIVPKMSGPWIVTPLQLAGNKELVFEPGVEILAKRGEFRGKTDCLFAARNQENLTIRGPGAVFRMRREEYAAAPYEKSEWRHCLSLRGCRNVQIEGLTLAESGGDGIYLGTGQNGEHNQDITIRDVICEKNYRQGISVITAKNLLMENVTLRGTAGTAPAAGIDFEPNLSSECLENCVMRNCLIEDNQGYAIHVSVGSLNAESSALSIRFENCRTRGSNGASISIASRNGVADAARGTVEITGCHFEEDQTAAIVFRSKPVHGIVVRVKDSVLSNSSPKPRWPAPVVFISGGGDENDLGQVLLDNLVVRDTADRPPLAFLNSAGVCLRQVMGRIVLERPNGRETVTLDAQLLERLFPCDPIRQLPIVTLDTMKLPERRKNEQTTYEYPHHRLRGTACYAFFAEKDEEVAVEVAYEPVGNYPGQPLVMQVIGPTGEAVAKARLVFREKTEARFSIPATGIYRLSAEPGSNTIRLVRSTHPMAILGQRGMIHLLGTRGRFHLFVPANQPVGVRVQGEPPLECVAARLRDQSGKTIWESKGCQDSNSFLGEAGAEDRTLVLELDRPAEGVLEDEVVVIRGVPAVLSFWPEGTPISP